MWNELCVMDWSQKERKKMPEMLIRIIKARYFSPSNINMKKWRIDVGGIFSD